MHQHYNYDASSPPRQVSYCIDTVITLPSRPGKPVTTSDSLCQCPGGYLKGKCYKYLGQAFNATKDGDTLQIAGEITVQHPIGFKTKTLTYVIIAHIVDSTQTPFSTLRVPQSVTMSVESHVALLQL
jgi:hypothetical protein